MTPQGAQAALARAFGVDVNELSPREVLALYPHLEVSDVVAGVHLPLDGQADSGNIALALAKGARQNGALVKERIRVTGIARDGRRVTGVDWAADAGGESPRSLQLLAPEAAGRILELLHARLKEIA